ncbi:6-pyruvoyl tetrahydropterin synthase family protein [Halomonas sp. HNIBRBA4712]|uniref:6-pyruvoyl trahydropterin synthase family protein n=1 Tax=Halomonas sp. HNIBRBA4712 TaxID=3373087 RepID=UPI0037452580
MYRLCVRDHFMIAHSFKGDIFGPAQRTHGATYVVDVIFKRPELDPDGLVIDIGLASETVKEVLAEYNFQNLDDVPAFKGKNTTTEFMAGVIFEALAKGIKEGRMGSTAQGITHMEVKLHESHVAWASYEGAL